MLTVMRMRDPCQVLAPGRVAKQKARVYRDTHDSCGITFTDSLYKIISFIFSIISDVKNTFLNLISGLKKLYPEFSYFFKTLIKTLSGMEKNLIPQPFGPRFTMCNVCLCKQIAEKNQLATIKMTFYLFKITNAETTFRI